MSPLKKNKKQSKKSKIRVTITNKMITKGKESLMISAISGEKDNGKILLE